MEPMIATVVFLLVAVGAGALFATHYKKCPSDKILVIYGKTTGGRFSRCIHGGSAFVWPLIQDYQFLDLTPISIDIKLEGISTLEDIQLDLSSIFTVGVSPELGVKENAAERLLGLTLNDIQHIAEDIIRTHMPPVIATMTFEELNAAKQTHDLGGRLHSLVVVTKLTKVGIRLINVIIQDVSISPGQNPNVGRTVESPPPFPREAGLGTEETETPANEL